MGKKTICILVLYNPSPCILSEVIESIIFQVDKLWISDNTPGGYVGMEEIYKQYNNSIVYSLMDGNVGIAKAQNDGVKYALERDFDFVYFLDQDSISPRGIVNGLVNCLQEVENKGIKVGGVGPLPYNRESGEPYKVDFMGRLNNNIIEVKDLMNSASLIKTTLFRDVGLMDEWLFIDGVDYEMCWRANYLAGYRFFINDSLHLSHKLGEGDKKLMGVSLKISTPFRTYYQFRNYLYFLRKNYVPVQWKVKNGLKYMVKYFYYPLFCKPRLQYFKNINRGIIDGVKE